MRHNRLTEAMLRAAVSKIVRNMKEDPERGIKTTRDSGKIGFRQAKEILELVARELSDKNSAYYKLITDLIFRTDQGFLPSLE